MEWILHVCVCVCDRETEIETRLKQGENKKCVYLCLLCGDFSDALNVAILVKVLLNVEHGIQQVRTVAVLPVLPHGVECVNPSHLCVCVCVCVFFFFFSLLLTSMWRWLRVVMDAVRCFFA